MIYSKAINETLRYYLETDERVVVLGEDIIDPYGGAFKVTKGLSTDFPDRVRTMPVSEAAIAGISAGLALEGFRPISEVMFGDFAALCFDQIVNHMAKYEAMYNGKATCPVVMRMPSGGGRGYGPTHSQSLEKYFVGVPHLNVVAASLHHDPKELFAYFFSQDKPTIFVEHKLLYPLKTRYESSDNIIKKNGLTVSVSPVPREDCSVTVVSYGYMAHLAEQVIQKLAIEEEIFVELVIAAKLSPIEWPPIEESVASTGALLTVEEGTAGWAWGTEVATHIQEKQFGQLRQAVKVLTSEADVIPAARPLEDQMLMNPKKIEKAIRTLSS